MKNLIAVVAVLMFATSCGTSKTKLSDGGRNVKIMKYKKNKGCRVLNKVVGENDNGLVELAENHARNLAAKEGGNAIYFNEKIQNGNSWRVHSTAFSCE